MKYIIPILLILNLCANSLYSHCSSDSINNQFYDDEISALVQIYIQLDGKNWERQHNWKKNPDNIDNLYGIDCAKEKKTVIAINLSNNQLKGELPADIKKLKNLKVLNLSGNKIYGKIPPKIGELKELEVLNLSDNGFEGEIPAELQHLTKLKILNLSGNNLSGRIPSWIGKLESLEELILNSNQLSGGIPRELANLPKLKKILLANNELSGVIPRIFKRLSSMEAGQSDFRYNALNVYKISDGMKTWVNRVQISGDGWQATQLVPPKSDTIMTIEHHDKSVKIKWDPVDFHGKKGGYRITYWKKNEKPNIQPAIENTPTPQIELDALEEKSFYNYTIQTWIERNSHRIYSDPSDEQTTGTGGIQISGKVYIFTDTAHTKKEHFPFVKIVSLDKKYEAESYQDGHYTLNVHAGWTGKLEAQIQGFKFDAIKIHKDYWDTPKNKNINLDFNGKPLWYVKGRVTEKTLIDEGKPAPPLEGVTISFVENGKITDERTTDEEGYYEMVWKKNWSGSIKPQKEGYYFLSGTENFDTQKILDHTINFRALQPIVSGKVMRLRKKSNVLPDVEIEFKQKKSEKNDELDKEKISEKSDSPTKTKNNGEYEEDLPVGWEGQIGPKISKEYTFYPERKEIRMGKDDIVLDFYYEKNYRMFIVGTLGLYLPSNEQFNAIYKNAMIPFGLYIGYRFYNNIFFRVGGGWFKKSGSSTELNEPAEWSQKYFSLGLGYLHKTKNFISAFHGGLLFNRYEEQAFGETASGKSTGWDIEAMLLWKYSDRFLFGPSAGYLWNPIETSSLNGFKFKLNIFYWLFKYN